MKLRQVAIDKIKIPETRVTSYFSAEVYQEFSNSIKAAGIMEPIICVEVGEDLYLVDGKNRLVQAKEKGDKTVPVAVMPGTEADIYLQNLFLNVMRGKPKVREMREVIGKLYQEYQMGVDSISSKTGLSEAFINDLLVISGLPDEIVAAFDEERLAKGKALAIAKLPTPELQVRLFYMIDGRNIAVADVVDIAAQMVTLVGTPPPPPAPVIPEAERVLACDMCHIEKEIRWLKSVFLCSECESLLRYQLGEIERQAQNSQTALDKPVG